MYSLSSNGQLCIWECDTELDGLIPWEDNEPVEQEEEIEIDDDEKEEEDKGKG